MAYGMYQSTLDTMARTMPRGYDTDAEFERMRDAFVRNTMMHVGSELWAEGLAHAVAWYPLAHAVATGMSQYDLSMIQSSAIVAAQSINCSWQQNEIRAVRAAKTRSREGVPTAASKTIAVMQLGQSATVADVLKILNGQKIMRFFLNILTCEDDVPSDDVTLDRFMARGCDSKQSTLTHGIVYDTMDRAFRAAMDIVSELTGVTFGHYFEWQAFTWGLFRGSYF